MIFILQIAAGIALAPIILPVFVFIVTLPFIILSAILEEIPIPAQNKKNTPPPPLIQKDLKTILTSFNKLKILHGYFGETINIVFYAYSPYFLFFKWLDQNFSFYRKIINLIPFIILYMLLICIGGFITGFYISCTCFLCYDIITNGISFNRLQILMFSVISLSFLFSISFRFRRLKTLIKLHIRR